MRRIFLVALLGLGMMDMAWAADFSFSRPSRVTLTRHSTGSVGIGDANGDGRKDLVVAEDLWWTDTHQLSLFIQRADGSFAAPVRMALPAEASFSYPVAFADLDNDGYNEVLVGSSTLNVARFNGSALILVSSHAVRFGCSYLVTGDIDSDGKPDVVCHSGLGTPTSASLFYGNGAGGFRNKTEMLTNVGSYGFDDDFIDVRLADVTGDGRPDLLVTASRVDHFFVYPNDGVGGISPIARAYPHPWSPTGVWPAALEVLDLDGDGINEVVTASPDNQPDAKLNVYRRGAAGYLVLSERLPLYDSTTALVAADVDGDGDKELVAGHFGFNAVSVLGANAPGLAKRARYELPGFGAGMALYAQVGRSKTLATGDLNGDGCIDLAGATISGTTVLYGCRPFRSRLPATDLDGDGVSDLVWMNDVFKDLSLWQWADAQTYTSCRSPCPRWRVPPWTMQAIGDFDGDGSSDMFWRNGQTGENTAIIAARYERSITSVTSQDWQVVGAGDFDGDDKSDLLWRNRRTGANAIWKSGDYRTQQAMRSVTDVGWQVVGVGDFNGDGRSDILWRHARSGNATIWLSGRFETQGSITAVTNLQWRVQGVGDFNGDGKEDLVWHNAGTGASAIWFSADYRTQQAVTTVANVAWNIGAVGDYNGDGRSDLMWRNIQTGVNAIWLSGRYETQQPVQSADTWMVLLK